MLAAQARRAFIWKHNIIVLDLSVLTSQLQQAVISRCATASKNYPLAFEQTAIALCVESFIMLTLMNELMMAL